VILPRFRWPSLTKIPKSNKKLTFELNSKNVKSLKNIRIKM